MNPMAKALKSKINRAVDAGGNFIAQKIMLQPALDYRRGERADRDREEILRRRDTREYEKSLGY